MAAGTTTSGSAADSLNVIIDSATLVREYVGSYSRTVTMERLPVGTGLSWDEVSTAQLTAQSITETTELNNPQQFVDSILSLTPTQCGIMTRVTKKAKHRLSPKVLATWGSGAQKAMDRYKNDQYLALLDTATVSQPGAASTLSQGVIGAMARQITSNTTAPATSAIYTVLRDVHHSFRDDRGNLQEGFQGHVPGDDRLRRREHHHRRVRRRQGWRPRQGSSPLRPGHGSRRLHQVQRVVRRWGG